MLGSGGSRDSRNIRHTRGQVLGSLYSATDRGKSLERLTKATELAPDDVDAWLETAKVPT